MKNRDCFKLLAVTGAILFLTAGASMAMDKEQGAGPSSQGKGQAGDHWKDQEKGLGLTPEQQAKMKALREDSRVKQEAIKDQLKAKHEALRQELDSASPDKGKAMDLVKQISALQEQMGTNRIDMAFKIREILTPEQYKKLREFHEKNKDMRAHRRENKGGEQEERNDKK